MHTHTNIFMQTLFTVHVMQGPVSFSDIGIRDVNRLKVMQYRNVTGLRVCAMTASWESLCVYISANTTCAIHIMLRTNCKFVNMPPVAVIYVK